jgi:hypothetical protein
MWTNGSPPKTTIMAPPRGVVAAQQPDDNVGVSDDNAGNTHNKYTQLGEPAN